MAVIVKRPRTAVRERTGRGVRSAAAALARLHLEVVVIAGVAAALDLWSLGRNAWANTFYAAAVRSMSLSGHNFLFASFDPTGVMSIDKPPLAFWLQTASVKAFGFHPLSILVPQAVLGVATVVIVYDLTRRRFGRAAGFVAGLVLATTPITVGISRDNNPDAMLIFLSAAALWCAVRALEMGRVRWLVLAGVCVGLGFETKMAAALLVFPGLVAAWSWSGPTTGRTKVLGLAGMGAATVAVGGAWPLLVALTPAANRPWLGGTTNNNIVSLMTGYNGLGRIAGQAGGPSSVPAAQTGGGLFGGAPGPFRLLDESLGGQAGWLLGTAVVAGLALVVTTRLRRRDPLTGWLLAAGGAFATTAVAFSSAGGIFHPYYTSLLAPFTAALVGAGFAVMRRSGWAAALGVLAGAATEAVVIHHNPEQIGWLGPLVVAGTALLAAALLSVPRRARQAVLASAFALLLVAPSVWAVQTLGHPTSPTFPAGGLAGSDAIGAPVVPRVGATRAAPRRSARARNQIDQRDLAMALAYARVHGGGALGVRSQLEAAPDVIATGADVAGLGGFSGAESEPSVAWLANDVATHRLRFVLETSVPRVVPGHRVGATTVLQAVATTCPAVAPTAWTGGLGKSAARLYDCRYRVRSLVRYARLAPAAYIAAARAQ